MSSTITLSPDVSIEVSVASVEVAVGAGVEAVVPAQLTRTAADTTNVTKRRPRTTPKTLHQVMEKSPSLARIYEEIVIDTLQRAKRT
jgi:hypothetical protein